MRHATASPPSGASATSASARASPRLLARHARLLRVCGDIGLTAFPLGTPGPGETQRYLACRAGATWKLLPLLPETSTSERKQRPPFTHETSI